MSRNLILEAFTETPWAILPHKLAALEEVVARYVSGEKLSAEEIAARIGDATRPDNRMTSGVAVLPLFGTIFPRANMMTEISGATSAERFGADFSALLDDPNIGAIVLDVNSPGGQIGGVDELSSRIYAARGRKPVVAVANHLMASAAYWIATAADEVVVTPSGEVGSIGVFTAHVDRSKALEQEGVKVSMISAGKYKTEGSPYEPLAKEALGAIQSRVNDVYETFVSAVARNRGKSADEVRGGFGEGRTVSAAQAVKMGMADRVSTLEETVSLLLQNQPRSASVSGSPSAEDLREAQSLRARVNQILNKE